LQSGVAYSARCATTQGLETRRRTNDGDERTVDRGRDESSAKNAAKLQVDRDREFVRLGLVMLTALAVAVEMMMRW
jgi:hypothetical protein